MITPMRHPTVARMAKSHLRALSPRSSPKLLIAALIAALTVSALAVSTASAEWMVAGKNFSSSAALASTSKTDKSVVLSDSSLTVTCTGNIGGSGGEIFEGKKARGNSVIFSGCSASPTTCSVPTTIGTTPLQTTVEKEGTAAVKGVIVPQTGTVLATISVTGTECSVGGVQNVTGDVAVKGPGGQTEKVDQPLEINQSASGLLKLGTSAASLSGTALLLLKSSETWSFL